MTETTIDIDERDRQIEDATAEVCEHQQHAEAAWVKVASHQESLKEAKEIAKDADVMMAHAAKRLRRLREGRFPDPEKFPLLDTSGVDARQASNV
jgi:hypothetical protein